MNLYISDTVNDKHRSRIIDIAQYIGVSISDKIVNDSIIIFDNYFSLKVKSIQFDINGETYNTYHDKSYRTRCILDYKLVDYGEHELQRILPICYVKDTTSKTKFKSNIKRVYNTENEIPHNDVSNIIVESDDKELIEYIFNGCNNVIITYRYLMKLFNRIAPKHLYDDKIKKLLISRTQNSFKIASQICKQIPMISYDLTKNIVHNLQYLEACHNDELYIMYLDLLKRYVDEKLVDVDFHMSSIVSDVNQLMRILNRYNFASIDEEMGTNYLNNIMKSIK